MPKRILLAEESDTIRGIAENLLRQNGYEVLSITSGEKAMEVLNFTRPDLIVLASDLKFKGSQPMFEKLQADSKNSGLPLLLMADHEEKDLDYPPEVVVTKPFDPKEFLEKVTILSGVASSQESQKKQAAEQDNPLASSEVEEEFLDAALGLDRLDITDSEVMNQTSTKIKTKKKMTEKMIGYDHSEDVTDITSDNSKDSGKVESLMIQDENAEIDQVKKKTADSKSDKGSGLDILDDQFGLIEKAPLGEGIQDSDHDYSWFLNELKNENSSKKPSPQLEESQKLSFQDNSTHVNPVTPAQATPKKSAASGSVDKFIDEFKKEVEKFSSDEPESITINESSDNVKNNSSSSGWQDTVESISPQQIAVFKKQFVSELAERLAEKISAKIDPEKLLVLLKQEIIKQSKK